MNRKLTKLKIPAIKPPMNGTNIIIPVEYIEAITTAKAAPLKSKLCVA